MRKHPEHRGDGGSVELHHSRPVGSGTSAAPWQGFLSLMRAAIAVLGFLLMAATSDGRRRPIPCRLRGQVLRGGSGTRMDVESV